MHVGRGEELSSIIQSTTLSNSASKQSGLQFGYTRLNILHNSISFNPHNHPISESLWMNITLMTDDKLKLRVQLAQGYTSS